MNTDRVERYIKTMVKIPTGEEYQDILAMSRRGFFGGVAAMVGAAYFNQGVSGPRGCPIGPPGAPGVGGLVFGPWSKPTLVGFPHTGAEAIWESRRVSTRHACSDGIDEEHHVRVKVAIEIETELRYKRTASGEYPEIDVGAYVPEGWSESPLEMGEIAARQESLHARVPTTGAG